MRTAAVATLVAALVFLPRVAGAQEFVPNTVGVQPPTTRYAEQKHPYWESAVDRPFVAAIFDFGVFFIRPTLQLGYGKPHWRWFGVEGYSSLSTVSFAEYGGVHAALQWLDVRAGVRYSSSLVYHFLPEQDTYTRDDTETKVGERARYLSAETEAAVNVPVPFGSFFVIATGYVLNNVPSNFLVLEDTLHVVVKAPLVWRARAGVSIKASSDGVFKVGFAAEAINVPGREDLWVVRVGPQAALQLTYHLDAFASILPIVAARDSLGLIGADFGQIGLRYRWATNDRFRDFP